MSTVTKKSKAKSSKKQARQKSSTTEIIPIHWVNYHVFRWICHSEDVDVDDLLAKAIETAEQDEHYGVCTHLTSLLEDLKCEWETEWVGRMSDGILGEADEIDSLAYPDSPVDLPVSYMELIIPVLQLGWRYVSTSEVAQAILRHKGMWRK